MTKTQTILAVPAILFTLLVGGAIAGYATLAAAQSTTTGAGTTGTMMGKMGNHGPHIHGDVTAVNGTTITMNDERTSTSYTVDASAASFKKMSDGAAPATVTISEMTVGDEITVMGTISGTTVTATDVMEGEMKGHGMGGHGGRGPGVMGTVSAVNGSTVTVSGRDGTTYTVQAAAATVQKMTTGSLADVRVGDTIGVRGTVSGTTITATNIMDDLPVQSASATKSQ